MVMDVMIGVSVFIYLVSYSLESRKGLASAGDDLSGMPGHG